MERTLFKVVAMMPTLLELATGLLQLALITPTATFSLVDFRRRCVLTPVKREPSHREYPSLPGWAQLRLWEGSVAINYANVRVGSTSYRRFQM